MLELRDVVTYYGPIPALKGISLTVRQGEIVCLLGGNASGKSTTMKTILGVVRPHRGSVSSRTPDRRPAAPGDRPARHRAGAGGAPPVRRMTVLENLAMGAYTRRGAAPAELEADRERVFTLFPRLAERRSSWPAPCPAASSRCSRSAGR